MPSAAADADPAPYFVAVVLDGSSTPQRRRLLVAITDVPCDALGAGRVRVRGRVAAASPPGGSVPPRLRAGTAALLTVVAAVLLDTAAGAEVAHVVGLGLLAAAVGALRLLRFGREHPSVTAAAGAMVVSQPAAHLAVRLSERTAAALEPTAGAVHLAVLVLHVVLAVATALLVAAADVLVAALLQAIGDAVGRFVRLVTRTVPEVGNRARWQACVTPERALRPILRAAYALRRGPPALARAV